MQGSELSGGSSDWSAGAPSPGGRRDGRQIVPFPTEEVVAAENLTKTFVSSFRRKRTAALNGLNLNVKPGEVFGLLGPNGAGKSTTIKLIMGLIRPTSGEVRLLGRTPSDVEAKSGVGYLSENPSFYSYLTGFEFLDYCGGLLGMESGHRREIAERFLKDMDLWACRNLRIKKYSKGMIQRLGFAQALLGEPKLLILDEPMSGLDPIGRRLVREGIFEVRARGGTVLFSSHILPDVETICDRVGILVGGRLQRVVTLDGRSMDEKAPVELIMDKVDQSIVEEIVRSGAGMRRRGDTCIFKFEDSGRAQRALVRAVGSGARVHAYNRLKESLENLFLRELQPQARERKRRAG
jgi:ABC-2 type transport system ATP-binding protein